MQLTKKKTAIMALALIFCVGIVSAALLPYFGQIITTVDVKQAVLLDGTEIQPIQEPITQVAGGESFCRYHWLTSQTSVPVKLEFGTTYDPDGNGIVVSYYSLEEHTLTCDTEVLWIGGAPKYKLPDGEKLQVVITYQDDYVVFNATIPDCYDPETSYTTFTFDTDADGLANFQIQYNDTTTHTWLYSEVKNCSGTYKWSYAVDGWSTVPEYFVVSHEADSRSFVLKVPLKVLGDCGSSYKFGVQTDRWTTESDEKIHLRQIFISTAAGELWWNGVDYVHSTYYVPMTLGTEITEPFTLGPHEILPFYICYKFDKDIFPTIYTITTTVKLAPE